MCKCFLERAAQSTNRRAIPWLVASLFLAFGPAASAQDWPIPESRHSDSQTRAELIIDSKALAGLPPHVDAPLAGRVWNWHTAPRASKIRWEPTPDSTADSMSNMPMTPLTMTKFDVGSPAVHRESFSLDKASCGGDGPLPPGGRWVTFAHPDDGCIPAMVVSEVMQGWTQTVPDKEESRANKIRWEPTPNGTAVSIPNMPLTPLTMTKVDLGSPAVGQDSFSVDKTACGNSIPPIRSEVMRGWTQTVPDKEESRAGKIWWARTSDTAEEPMPNMPLTLSTKVD